MVDAAQGCAGVETIVAVFVVEDRAEGRFEPVGIGAELREGYGSGTAHASVFVGHGFYQCGQCQVRGFADVPEGFA